MYSGHSGRNVRYCKNFSSLAIFGAIFKPRILPLDLNFDSSTAGSLLFTFSIRICSLTRSFVSLA